MKRALMWSMLMLPLALGACGKGEDDPNSGTNGTTATNNDTSSTNGTTGSNNSTQGGGVCEWGAFIASCGGGPEADISARAVGCREYYEPGAREEVTQDAVCDGLLWAEDAGCSDSGLSGRRPLGCCFESDGVFNTRHCFYDDPLAIEASAALAEDACTGAGFCWIPPEMM